MLLLLVQFLHLLLISHIGLNAAPIFSNTSDVSNRTFNLKQRTNHFKNELLNNSLTLPKLEKPTNFNLTQIVKDLKQFGIDSLKDDTHLEGFPLDRQGKHNPDFHKEIFLGNHESFETVIQNDKTRLTKKLEEIFNQADLDHDQRLSKDELVKHVFRNVQQHLQEARDKNIQLFVLIDTNEDGKITWQEYASLYIKFHHLNMTKIKEFDDVDFVDESFDMNLRRELLKIRYWWMETDHGHDNQLDIDEFLMFRHPEIGTRSYEYMVANIISQMDLDGDEKLKEFEFVPEPSGLPGGEVNKERAESDKQWFEEQKQEFREIDENGDGELTRDELLKVYDPMNRVHINLEVKKLFSKVDDSPVDNHLSLDEIQKHADIFTDMRLLDISKVLHDEM